MTVKEHYDNLLGKVYSWMVGDFQERVSEQMKWFSGSGIAPAGNRVALDLGAGNGIQSVALAKLGFNVIAVDFSHQLLAELTANKGQLPIDVIEKDISEYLTETRERPELVVCMGDTLTHLRNMEEVIKLIAGIATILPTGGRLIFSYRDLDEEKNGPDRFIHVRSDEARTLICFLEYLPEVVMVHDILVEKNSVGWKQYVSSYPKLRLPLSLIRDIFQANAMRLVQEEIIRGMAFMIAEKIQADRTQ